MNGVKQEHLGDLDEDDDYDEGPESPTVGLVTGDINDGLAY